MSSTLDNNAYIMKRNKWKKNENDYFSFGSSDFNPSNFLTEEELAEINQTFKEETIETVDYGGEFWCLYMTKTRFSSKPTPEEIKIFGINYKPHRHYFTPEIKFDFKKYKKLLEIIEELNNFEYLPEIISRCNIKTISQLEKKKEDLKNWLANPNLGNEEILFSYPKKLYKDGNTFERCAHWVEFCRLEWHYYK